MEELEKDLGDMLLEAGVNVFTEEGGLKDIDNLNEEEILSNKTFETLFAIENPIERERLYSKCLKRVKELRLSTRVFNNIYKQYKENYIKNLKSIKSNETNFTDCEYKFKCGNWITNDTGVYKEDYTNNGIPIKIKASSIPVLPTERLVNIDTNTEKVKLNFFKDGNWNPIIVEKNTIASKNKILQLANRGVEVTEDNAKNLITYLSDILELNNIPVVKRSKSFRLD